MNAINLSLKSTAEILFKAINIAVSTNALLRMLFYWLWKGISLNCDFSKVTYTYPNKENQFVTQL